MTEKWAAIIPAAGSSTRMNGIDKTLFEINGTPVLAMILKKLRRAGIDEIYIGIRTGAGESIKNQIFDPLNMSDVHLINGGATRQQTVARCIGALDKGITHVLVHDCARPHFSLELIKRVKDETVKYGAVCVALPVSDTIHRAGSDMIILETPMRSGLWVAQTPQAFRRDLLEEAHAKYAGQATDDASMVSSMGHSVRLVNGERTNTKITYPEDIGIGHWAAAVDATK